MKLLDLFCGAGGASMGYHRAGFEVVGVDIEPQPYYPFEFHQADAMTYSLEGFDVIHASPPCQAYSTLGALTSNEYPDLIAPVRDRLRGHVYVIENVPGSPLSAGLLLCGTMFGLGVRRHRYFEGQVPLLAPASCRHDDAPVDVSGMGGLGSKPRAKPGGGRSRKPADLAEARKVMGIPWADRRGISQAIPPVYTEYIGKELLRWMNG